AVKIYLKWDPTSGIRAPTLDFENVYYVKELQQFNLFSISQICDKKNRVLFTDTDCLVLSKDFMLPEESMVLLRVPRKNNLYTINLNNLSPKRSLACLMAKASVDEYVQWHRRMGHVNYKNMNRLVKGNLVRGLPSKLFKNDHTCVACCKGKQHKASYKAITAVSSIFEPLQLLYMDLFGPTSIRSIDHKYYCLVIIDDYSINTDLCRRFMCSSQDSSRLDVAVKFIFQSSRYVVPTGRVVVPTGRYVVPASKVIIIVSPGRLNLVLTGRILSPGSKDLSRVGSNIYYERGDKVIFDEKKLGSS
ncbi:putative ribonuclease H-like domain-containing protein, partial [Tanacetum coccineum]